MRIWLGSVISKCWKHILFLCVGAGKDYFYRMGSLSFMNLFSMENFVIVSVTIVQNVQIWTCISTENLGGSFKSALFFIDTFEYRQSMRGWISVVFCTDWISQFFGVYFSTVSISYILRSPIYWDATRPETQPWELHSLKFNRWREECHVTSRKGDDQPVNGSYTHSDPCSRFHGYS